MNRIEQLQEKLKENTLDGIFLNQPENIYYFTGFWGDLGGLVISQQQSYLVVDSRFTEQAKEETGYCLDLEVIEADRPWLIGDICADMQRIGFEEDFITIAFYGELKKACPNASFVAASQLPKDLRMIKDEAEIEEIKMAVEIADAGFHHILSYIKEGVSEIEIANELDFYMRSLGASGPSFDLIVAGGARSALPHGTASEAVLKAHEPVLLDFGCIYHHYCSDMTRTVFLGDPGEEIKAMYRIVLEGQKRGYANCLYGHPVAEAEMGTRRFFNEHQCDQFFGHSLGHGVGLQIHEDPFVNRKNDKTRFVNNMIYTIEPGIYIPGECGIRIEDTVEMTYFGPVNLCKAPKDLIIL